MSQKFWNILVGSNNFAEDVSVTNHTALWDVELTFILLVCLLPRFISMACSTALEPMLLNLPNLVFATWPKFLEPSGSCTLINYVFTFFKINVFGFICCTVTISNSKHTNSWVRHSSVHFSNHTQNEAMHNMSVHQLPQYYQGQYVTFYSLNSFYCMISSSLSCCTISTDISDPLSSLLGGVFQATSCISTDLLYIGSSWSSYLYLSIRGVHRSILLMSSSLLLQQCPTCLVRLTLIVFVMGGR